MSLREGIPREMTQTTAPRERKAPRFNLRAPVEFRGDGFAGDGVIWNISRCGALVEDASATPPLYAQAGLAASYYPGSSEIELWGEVVRTTRTGFAVEFTTMGESALALLSRILPLSTRLHR